MEWILLGLGLLLVLACGAFVAAEFSLVTVDRATVERGALGGDKRSQGTLLALQTLSTQLSGAQLGITLTNLGVGFLAEPALASLLEGPLTRMGLDSAAVSTTSVVIALVLATLLTMVLGELIPKNLALALPLQTARFVQGFQRLFTRLARWPIQVLNGSANAILRSMGIEPMEELASARSPQELAALVQRSADKGTLETSTATLLRKSLAFGDRRAQDVLTSRQLMSTLPHTARGTDVFELAIMSGHSRFPVLSDGGDEVLGVVHVRDVISVPYEERSDVAVSTLMVAPTIVPETLELDALLEVLRAGGLQMAVVVDEFGGINGVVTLEDLVEEIVGEVKDEHDTDPDGATQETDGSWDLSGLLRPDEVSEQAGFFLPESREYETLAGYLIHSLGRMPQVGDSVELETDGALWHLRVSSLEGHRIDRVQATPTVLTIPERKKQNA